jgi:hypothetical protein
MGDLEDMTTNPLLLLEFAARFAPEPTRAQMDERRRWLDEKVIEHAQMVRAMRERKSQ